MDSKSTIRNKNAAECRALLEGDQKLTMELCSISILEHLVEAVENGYDIVCSCPTCGFMLRNILKEGAYYSPEYQESVGADETYIKIPLGKASNNPRKSAV